MVKDTWDCWGIWLQPHSIYIVGVWKYNPLATLLSLHFQKSEIASDVIFELKLATSCENTSSYCTCVNGVCKVGASFQGLPFLSLSFTLPVLSLSECLIHKDLLVLSRMRASVDLRKMTRPHCHIIYQVIKSCTCWCNILTDPVLKFMGACTTSAFLVPLLMSPHLLSVYECMI